MSQNATVSQHTPGPWRIAFGGMPQDDYAVIGSPHSDRAVCNLEPRDYNLANARLIVAAPSLLESLVNLLAAYRDSINGPEVDAARAAIAAARGN